jgi:hypothetical protein
LRSSGGSTRADRLTDRVAGPPRADLSVVAEKMRLGSTVLEPGFDLTYGGKADVRVLDARLWLFDIVKRVLTYSLLRGAGRACADARVAVLGLGGVKRVI